MERMNKQDADEAEFARIVQEIEENSPYKRREPKPRTTMTVREMGDMLGLKKTERYWLVHKEFFKTEVIGGQMRVDIASFEKWYAGQVKYKKVDGEEPGSELKKRSYSIRDIAHILNVPESTAYDLVKRAGLPCEIVDYWKRYPKEAFDEWYKSQERYFNAEDRELNETVMKATMSMPEMAKLLGIKRDQAYNIIYNAKNDIEIIKVGEKKRISKVSFYRWYKHQDHYKIRLEEDTPAIAREENRDLEKMRRVKMDQQKTAKNMGNQKVLTREEAASIADVNVVTISNWIKAGYFPAVKRGKFIRIYREPFEEYVKSRKEKK